MNVYIKKQTRMIDNYSEAFEGETVSKGHILP